MAFSPWLCADDNNFTAFVLATTGHIRRQDPGLPIASLRLSSIASKRARGRRSIMSKESENKEIVGRWFSDFWGERCNLAIVDELAAPDMLLQYSLHAPRRGRQDIK